MLVICASHFLSGLASADYVPDWVGRPVWQGLDPEPAGGPDLSDSDVDRLPAWHEAHLGTDPNDPDSDDDLIMDGDEVWITGTNPTLPSTAGNGTSDYAVFIAASGYTGDLNANGIPDSQESELWGLYKTRAEMEALDTDGDGLSNWTELWAGGYPGFTKRVGGQQLIYPGFIALDPNNPDTDGDGISDFHELQAGTHLLPPSEDADRDGLPAFVTDTNGQNPIAIDPDDTKSDTDDDGLPDGFEWLYIGKKEAITDTDYDNDSVPDFDDVIHGGSPVGANVDEDSLGDVQEIYTFGTHPSRYDTDDDGLDDWAETLGPILLPNEYHPTNPASKDTDGDGLTDLEEHAAQWFFPLATAAGENFNPTLADTDGDGTPDWQEAAPDLVDSDGGGVPDAIERWYYMNPANAADDTGDIDSDGIDNVAEYLDGTQLDGGWWRHYDWDFDGMSNVYEIHQAARALSLPLAAAHPHDPRIYADSEQDPDEDGLLNHLEVLWRTDPYAADTDGDGLNDGEELTVGSHPLQWDSDGDGMSDGWEVAHGLDPASATGNGGAQGDPDADGLGNLEEYAWGSDPNAADSDGDGWDDGQEMRLFGSATDAGSTPLNLRWMWMSYQCEELSAHDSWGYHKVGVEPPLWAFTKSWSVDGDVDVSATFPTSQPAAPAPRSYPMGTEDSPWYPAWTTWNFISGGWFDPARPDTDIGVYIQRGSNSSNGGESANASWFLRWQRHRIEVPEPLPVDYEENYLAVVYQWNVDDVVDDGYGGSHYPAGPEVKDVFPVTLTLPKGQTTGPWAYITPRLLDDNTITKVRLLPVEIKVVNRDDPTKTWTTGPVTSGPLAYTSPTISEVSDVKNGDLISWSVPGLTGGSFQWWATGPSGSRKDAPSSVTGNEWKLEDPLDWLPGKWRIHCRYTPSSGAATEFDFEQNLGYRSPDITVIGWIDGTQIILPSGADKPLYKPGVNPNTNPTVEQSMNNLVDRLLFLNRLALGDTLVVPLSPDPARRYVNAYLIKSSPNNAPPAEFQQPWPGFENRKMVDAAGLNQFKSQTDKFRSFHRFQARFELDATGKIKGAPHFLKQATQVGVTPVDWLEDPPGETGPHDGTVNTTGASIQINGKTHSSKLADDFEQYTQGRISTSGTRSGGNVSKQINNLKVPWIWSLIEFGAAHARAGTTAVPEHEIFPVYHVYYNGKRIDTLTNSISEAKMEEFIQLGEPNVP